MEYPNLYIAGVMKSATTSLCEYLNQHPEIFMAAEKEPFFFTEAKAFIGEEELLYRPDVGSRLCRAKMGSGEFSEERAYLSLFKGGDNFKYCAEGSPLYFVDPNVPERIKAIRPDAKIIIILRDPVERAYSAFNFLRSFNREPCLTFMAALEDELAGNRDEWWYGWRFIYSGMYAKHVLNWLKSFDSNQILFVRYDDLVASPQSVFASIFDFLSLESCEIEIQNKRNVTRLKNPLLVSLFNNLYANNPLKYALARVLPLPFRKKLNARVRRVYDSAGERPVALPENERQFLTEIFTPQVEELEDLLGWDLTSWKN